MRQMSSLRLPWEFSILHIEGLDNYTLPYPKLKRHSLSPGASSGPKKVPPYWYPRLWGNDFRSAYVPGTTLSGTGQNLGLLEFESYYPLWTFQITRRPLV